MPRISDVQLTAAAQLVEAALQGVITPPPPPPPDTTVASIVATPASITGLIVGQSQQITAVAKNAAGVVLSGVTFTYDVINLIDPDLPDFASVSNQGVVTAITAGAATVTISAGLATTSVPLTIIDPPPDTTPSTVTISPISATMTVGGANLTFSATVKNNSGVVIAGSPVVYSSSDASIVTINASTGVAHAVAAGAATITAHTSNGLTASASLTVNADTTPAGVVTSGPLSLTVGGPTGLITAHAVNASGATLSTPIVFTSSNTAIATVGSSTGIVTAVAAGTCNIHCTAGPANTDAQVVVAAAPSTPAAIAVLPTSASMSVGGADLTITATVTNASGQVISGAAVTWTTSNAAVAYTSSTGVVHAVAAGTCSITAHTSNGITASTAITVQADVTVATVTVAPKPLSGVANASPVQMTATAKNAAGVVVSTTFTWISDSPSIATVSSSGLVSFIAAGTAKITATSANGVSDASVVTVTAGGGTGTGESYSIISPHWTHMLRMWTDFGFNYRDLNDPAVQADLKLKASRMDWIMGGTHSNWTKYNPTIIWGQYLVVITCNQQPSGSTTSVVSGWGGNIDTPNSHAKTWADANGKNVEDLFLHYYDGQSKYQTQKTISAITATNPAQLTVTSHGYATGQRVEIIGRQGYQPGAATDALAPNGIPDGNYIVTVIDANTLSIPIASTSATITGAPRISNQLGDGTKTFANRMLGLGWQGAPVWYSSFAGTTPQLYHTYRLTPFFTDGDYVFSDATDTATIGLPFQLNPKISSLEYNTRGLNQAATNTVIDRFYQDYVAVTKAIRAANSNKRIMINPASYHNPNDGVLADASGGTQGEQAPINGNASDAWAWLNWAKARIAAGTVVEMVDSVFYTDAGPLGPTNPGIYSSGLAHWKMVAFGIYMMVVGSDASLWNYDDSNGRWTDNQATYYTKGTEAPLGHPLGPPVTTFQNVVISGVSYQTRISTREFENGLIILGQPNDRLSPNHYGSEGDVTVTLPTNANYYLVLDDLSVATTPTLTTNLGRLDVRVYLKQSGTAPPPPDTTTATVTVSPSSASIIVPQSTTLTAASANAAGTPLAGKTYTWTTSNAAVATVDSTGHVQAVASGVCTISAHDGSIVGSATITVQVSNATSGFPNARAGGTLMGGRDFTSKAATASDVGTGTDSGSGLAGGSQGFDASVEYNNAAFTIGSDSSAPNSPPSIGVFSWPVGATGYSPNGFLRDVTPSGVWPRVYFGISLMLPSSFPSAQTQLVRLIFGAREMQIYMMSGTNPTVKLFAALVSDPTYHGTFLPLNVDATKTMPRGAYSRIETELLTNTPGQSNGTAKLWLNSTLVASLTGLQFDSSATIQNEFTEHQIRPQPTFGAALTAPTQMNIDHALCYVYPS